ncbi:MAG: ATP-grasp domain-containing protein, partial [Solirubrobacterales bacterium]
MPRILLILPSATYRAPDFVRAAGELGVELVVGSDRRQAMSATIGAGALTLRLRDPQRAAQQICDHAEAEELDGIVAVDDQGIEAAALAAERLGLPHNPPAAVRAARDKRLLREAFDRRGVTQPAWEAVRTPAEAAGAAERLGTPCVVKPVGLSASRGVVRADSAAAATAAAERIAEILACATEPGLDHTMLVERYVPGEEVAVEGLVRGGELEVLAIFDKPDPLTGPFFEETLLVTPSRHPLDRQRLVAERVRAAVAALGLREGPVHAELRLPGDDAVVLEVAARSIGGLCARALRFGAGVSLEELILRHAIGAGLPAARENRAAGVMMLPISRAGTLEGVEGLDAAGAVPGIDDVEITIRPGRPVVPLPEGDRYLGFCFARGDTPDAVEQALRSAPAHLDVQIDDEPTPAEPHETHARRGSSQGSRPTDRTGRVRPQLTAGGCRIRCVGARPVGLHVRARPPAAARRLPRRGPAGRRARGPLHRHLGTAVGPGARRLGAGSGL